jgi:hypothetical protein
VALPLSGVFHADSWPRVKYADLDSNRYEHQQYPAFWCNTDRVLDFRSNGHIHSHACSNVAIRRGHLTPFFFKPKLEVKVLDRAVLPTDLAARAVESLSVLSFKAPEAMIQSISIIVRRSSARVGASLRFPPLNFPTHLNWNAPYKMDVESLRGESLVRQSPRYLELEKDDETVVWIWAASRGQDQPARVTFNVDPPVTFTLEEMPKEIDIDIQFIPIEKESRRFRLFAGSWDNLHLVEKPR